MEHFFSPDFAGDYGELFSDSPIAVNSDSRFIDLQ